MNNPGAPTCHRQPRLSLTLCMFLPIKYSVTTSRIIQQIILRSSETRKHDQDTGTAAWKPVIGPKRLLSWTSFTSLFRRILSGWCMLTTADREISDRLLGLSEFSCGTGYRCTAQVVISLFFLFFLFFRIPPIPHSHDSIIMSYYCDHVVSTVLSVPRLSVVVTRTSIRGSVLRCQNWPSCS